MPDVRALRRCCAVVTAAVVAAVAAGCGAGAGTAPSQTELLVTRDYGNHGVAQNDQPKVGGSDTVMRLLQRNVPKVTTRYGGNFVQSIDGLGGGRIGGRPFDWFFYVNGVESGQGATGVKVHAGDNVWWDYHDWGSVDRVPAVVGAFPEPFLHGIDGRKLPTRVECYQPKSAACGAIVDKLTDLGLPAFKGGIGNSFVADTLRILVGPWVVLRGDSTAKLLEGGPNDSGVFAKPAADGKSITLFDDRGRPTRTLGAGTGLVAATTAKVPSKNEDGKDSQDPIWIITGTDDQGVETAASAFDEGALSGRFAVALSGGKPVGLPEAQ